MFEGVRGEGVGCGLSDGVTVEVQAGKIKLNSWYTFGGVEKSPMLWLF